MFRGMWVDSQAALKGLGVTNPYSRCCDLQTTAVDSTNQAYDVNGYCTISPDNGGTLGPCEERYGTGQGVNLQMLLMIGAAVLLIAVLGKR